MASFDRPVDSRSREWVLDGGRRGRPSSRVVPIAIGLSLVQRIGPVDPRKTDFRHRLLAASRSYIDPSFPNGETNRDADAVGALRCTCRTPRVSP